jgi:hypothetical protein
MGKNRCGVNSGSDFLQDLLSFGVWQVSLELEQLLMNSHSIPHTVMSPFKCL